ncbi:MAG: hypothetical protein JWM20_558 [Patescibacteria group bacterium]|nr:hypothetical protein [Patescibacteria group bacterium]
MINNNYKSSLQIYQAMLSLQNLLMVSPIGLSTKAGKSISMVGALYRTNFPALTFSSSKKLTLSNEKIQNVIDAANNSLNDVRNSWSREKASGKKINRIAALELAEKELLNILEILQGFKA